MRLGSRARRLAQDLAEYRWPTAVNAAGFVADDGRELNLAAEFDRRVVDPDLRAATQTRFLTGHFADAVEAGVKALCACTRKRTGSSDDGDSLMTTVFSLKAPLLRINSMRSKNDHSEQRGHMLLCQGVIAAWRNPRAHTLIDDSPTRALMMLEMLNDLMATTKTAVRTRKRRAQ